MKRNRIHLYLGGLFLLFLAASIPPAKISAAKQGYTWNRKEAGTKGTGGVQVAEEPQARSGELWKRPPASGKRPQPQPARVGTQPKQPAPTPAQNSTDAVGLGYTLFRKSANGNPVRVNPTFQFPGDAELRLVFETATNGYLYVFNTTDGRRPAKMIFPHWKIRGGDNHVSAFVPLEIPSGKDPNPLRQWYVFKGGEAVEQFYVLVSREPIPGIPTGERLIQWCQANNQAVWRMPDEDWSSFLQSAQAEVTSGIDRTYDTAMSEQEREALAKEVVLAEDAPCPAQVWVNKKTTADRLMRLIEISHE